MHSDTTVTSGRALRKLAKSVKAGVPATAPLRLMVAARVQSFEAAIAVAFLVPLAFLLLRSLTLQINQSWAWFAWPLGVLALALALPWGRARRGIGALAAAIVLTGLPVVGGLLLHIVADLHVHDASR